MKMKHNTARQCDDVDRRRCDTEREMEETTLIGLTRILLGKKLKKIHAIDSADTNGH
jgi:hypothetical protein